jgi:hypothetical protein
MAHAPEGATGVKKLNENVSTLLSLYVRAFTLSALSLPSIDSYFIHQWLYSPLLGPGLFSFVIFFTQTVGLLGRVISPSQGRYLHTGQHKHRVNAHTDIHA